MWARYSHYGIYLNNKGDKSIEGNITFTALPQRLIRIWVTQITDNQIKLFG